MGRFVLPADFKPVPVIASGMMALRQGFAGNAITLLKPSTSAQASFAFDADGSLPTAAIDAFRAGEICRVIFRAEQMRGNHFTATAAMGPKIGNLLIGDHRCMWMEGDCQTGNEAPTGQVYGLTSANVEALGIPSNDYTVMQVVMIHNSSFNNQLVGLLRGCTFSMDSALGTHSRWFAEGVQIGNGGATTGGGYVFEDPQGLRVAPFHGWMETSPIVLTCTATPHVGYFIGQNEDFRSSPFQFALTRTGKQARIGFHEQSLPPTNPNVNEAMGMSELATLVWSPALTEAQSANVAQAFYELVPIDHRHSHSNTPLVVVQTDSVWAGYKADDLRGWDNVAMLQLPSQVRWANYGVGGQALLAPGKVTAYGDAISMFPGWVAQAIRQHIGRVHCVWGTPINDFGTGGDTPAVAYSRTLQLVGLVRQADPSATITLCTATRFGTPPNAQDDWATATSQLIRDGAAANNYGVVELRNDPVMSIPNLPAYKDGVHVTNFGADRMATLIMPRLQAWLASLGVT